jgi:hypothetical protein
MLENEREYKQSIEEMRQQVIILKNKIEQVEEEKAELLQENKVLSTKENERADEAWKLFVSQQKYWPLFPTYGK